MYEASMSFLGRADNITSQIHVDLMLQLLLPVVFMLLLERLLLKIIRFKK